jgi:hypothetical protein
MATQRQRSTDPVLTGKGTLRKGPRNVGTVHYTIHINPANCQASVVEFDPKPPIGDGQLVHLTLDDGRVVNCRILDESPYCAVVGDGPIVERRRQPRDE